MATLDHAAAHTLLARLPARERAEQQRRVELHGDEEDEAEQERQRMLLVELEKYEEQNDTLRQQLNRALDEIAEPKKQRPPKNDEERRLEALETELAHLEATLESLQTDPHPSIDPLLAPSPIVLEDALQSDILRTISELERGLAYEKQRGAKERKKGARDVVLLGDAEQLNELLKGRVQDARGEKENVTPRDLIDRAQAKADAVSSAFATLMGALVQFIDDRLAKMGDEDAEEESESSGKKAKLDMRDIRTYFKPTTTSQDDDSSFDPDSSIDPTTPAGKAHVLKQLLENLMNASATTPLDPWLTISGPPPRPGSKERYQLVPPELLDFLMRAGVVREHPQDGRRVRLEAFGRGVGA